MSVIIRSTDGRVVSRLRYDHATQCVVFDEPDGRGGWSEVASISEWKTLDILADYQPWTPTASRRLTDVSAAQLLAMRDDRFLRALEKNGVDTSRLRQSGSAVPIEAAATA